MKMKRNFVYLLSLVFIISGCDWSSGGDNGSYNSRFDWVNFSGVYRSSNGRYVVTDYSQGSPGSPSEQILETKTETAAVGNGSRTVFNGILSENDIEPGSAQFSTAGFSLVDQGNGTLSGSGLTGTIVYATGAWSIDFGGFAPDNGSRIICSYAYNLTTQATPATGSGSGSTGFELFSFTVNQTGEQLVLTDNTGRSYKGRMGSIRSTGGIDQDVDVSGETGAVAAVGDQVIGQFQASGVSPAGYEVKMTGVFQGVVGDGNQLAQRIMTGTWTEAGGRSGDINGAASPIAINANIAN